MKKLLASLTIVMFTSAIALAQEGSINYQVPQQLDKLPVFYIGLNSGLNSYSGIFGVGANVRLIDNAFVEGGAGIGSWGYKFSGGIRYDFRARNTFGIGVNYTTATGLRDMELDMELYDGSTRKVVLDLYSNSTVDIKGRFSINAGQIHKFYVELGYAIPVKDNNWGIKNGAIISSTSRDALEFIAPGGFIAGIGFMFGFKR